MFNNDNDHAITTVGGSAFNNCTALTSIEFRGLGLSKCTSFGGSVYMNCTKLKNPVYPSNYSSVASNSFNGCKALVSFAIPDTATAVNEKAFYNCVNLTTISGDASYSTIGAFAFASCNKLVNYSLPTSVSTIADSAFAGCTSLGKSTDVDHKFILPSALTLSWTGSKGMGANVFSGWDGTQTIYFRDANIIGGYHSQSTLTTLWGWTLTKVENEDYYLSDIKESGSGTVRFVCYDPTI